MANTHTKAEREDAQYEAWVLNDGPKQAELKHESYALMELAKLDKLGFDVVEYDKVRPLGHDVSVIRALIEDRRDGKNHYLLWHTGNRGWMTPSPSGGWVIWKAGV